MARAARISDFSHRVAICTSRDVVADHDTMLLVRPVVSWMWAAIRQPRPSYIGAQDGYHFKELADRLTHYVMIRQTAELDLTTAAWVYEEFLKAPPRWYKVIGFNDSDRSERSHRTSKVVNIACHLVEKSNTAAQPVEQPQTVPYLAPQPQGVKL